MKKIEKLIDGLTFNEVAGVLIIILAPAVESLLMAIVGLALIFWDRYKEIGENLN